MESTKKEANVGMANQEFWPIFQASSNPSLEIQDFLDKLKNEGTIL
jgi:hypothetical protein